MQSAGERVMGGRMLSGRGTYRAKLPPKYYLLKYVVAPCASLVHLGILEGLVHR